MDEETLRYSKQLVLDGIGKEGQRKINEAKILVVGAGGLGSPALTYLVSCGIGTVGIADFDTVTLSNLNRQILYSTEDLGKRKTEISSMRLKKINPGVEILKYQTRINIENVEEIIGDYDIVIDATDNFPTRYLLSDACYFSGKPVIEGAVVGYEGIIMTIIPGKTPCYRCLYPAPPVDGTLPTCGNTGILGMVTGVIGSLQALEAVKIVLGIGDLIAGRILTFDALASEFNNIKLNRNDSCPLCGKNPSIKELVEYEIICKKY